MATATVYKNFTQIVEHRSLLLITKDIQEGKYQGEIEQIRRCLEDGKKDEADKLKKQLPAFTASGKFEGGRTAEMLQQYSGFIILDLDKLNEKQLGDALNIARIAVYTFCCFRSPSGNGLKILVEVDSDAENHVTAYNQVADYYERALNLEIDRSGKDIPRLCFFSSDPDCYRNIQHEKFHVQLVQEDPEIVKEPESNWYEVFEKCITFTEQKAAYIEGNRNNFVYLLASNCNRAGMPEDVAIDLIGGKYDLNHSEIETSVKSSYQHHVHEFANFASAKPLQTENNEQDNEDYLLNSPVIPDLVYQALPDVLREGAHGFPDVRERDVFLTGAICILSGCLPNVSGVYAQRTVYPNLFGFIIAPAASGKGALLSAKNLGDVFHDTMRNNSDEARKAYEAELEQYKQAQRAKKKDSDETPEPPEEPPFNVLYVPANTSNAKILWHLQQNNGKGVICETEADTMGNVFKQEWGSYSDMLRKAFHHEKISCSRKTNNEFIEVKEPQLSVALSGTPNQVGNLIGSAEDGLFSRFLFYAFKTEQKWRDVSPLGGGVNLTELFNRLSQKVFELTNFLAQSKTDVLLTSNQWQRINSTFELWLTEVAIFTGDEAGSVVKRLGLILYRTCMLFTALRKHENGELTVQVTCTDEDFESALALANTYLQHSLLMYNNLPKQEDKQAFKGRDNKRKFFDALPDSFKRSEAVEIGGRFKLSPRSVDGLLKKLQPQYLIPEEYGHYKKV
ncbi:MAG: DUF3987 domain-containing protein [Crocinitomicaceae bacterium]|nr:DUF3987 domain-containing protein [Crocinitomicaceae bacterium]